MVGDSVVTKEKEFKPLLELDFVSEICSKIIQ